MQIWSHLVIISLTVHYTCSLYERVCVLSKGTKSLLIAVCCVFAMAAMQFQLSLDSYVATKQNPILLKGKYQGSVMKVNECVETNNVLFISGRPPHRVRLWDYTSASNGKSNQV